MDNGVSRDVLKGDSIRITSSSISDEEFKIYSRDWFPADLTITLYLVCDLNPIKLAVIL